MHKKDKELMQLFSEAFNKGVKTALNELRDVYGEGIEETDLWNEYMTKENN